MTHPAYLREKARRLRSEQRLTLDEITERLALPRGTVWSWIADLPGPPRRATPGQALGTQAMQRNYKQLRDDAYADGLARFDDLCGDPTFRDFVCMYIGEGFKRNRNVVSIGNSDPSVVHLANRWIGRFARNPMHYRLQYHADQDPDELRGFWGSVVGAQPAAVGLQRKSNSGQLSGRSWRSQYGVLTVGANDTLLRARLQGWMDCVRREWGYTRPTFGV